MEFSEGFSLVKVKDTNHGFGATDEMWFLPREDNGVRGEESLRVGILENECGEDFASEGI